MKSKIFTQFKNVFSIDFTKIVINPLYKVQFILSRTFYLRPADEVKPSVAKLPKPSLDAPALQTSVFSNPFVEAELAKAAILEKHVKMVYVDFLLL